MAYTDLRNQRAGTPQWPFASATVNAIDYASAIELNPINRFEVSTIGLLTGALALTCVPIEGIEAGSFLEVIATANGTNKTVTLGAGFNWSEPTYTAGAVTVTANKTVKMMFVYDGTNYVLTNVIQIN